MDLADTAPDPDKCEADIIAAQDGCERCLQSGTCAANPEFCDTTELTARGCSYASLSWCITLCLHACACSDG